MTMNFGWVRSCNVAEEVQFAGWEGRLRNDLFCIGWDVNLNLIDQSAEDMQRKGDCCLSTWLYVSWMWDESS